jgi:quinolinate synthase
MGLGDVSSAGVHIASTEGMIRAAITGESSQYIVATEIGIMHRMQQVAPDKEFVPADPEAVCHYMKTITLRDVRDALWDDKHVVTVPEEIAARARGAIDRMIALG